MHDEDLWLVKLDDGHVRSMTLDELDAAFQRDEVHDHTMICRSDGDRWITLAEELGQAPSNASAIAPPSTPPVVADVDEHHTHLASSHKGTRMFAIVLGVIVLGAFGAFAVTIAVNASRTRARAALAAQFAAAAAAEARAHDSDPEPEATTQTHDPNKPQNRDRRHPRKQTNGDQPQAPQDKPAATVFTNGGDDHDPLNAKL